MLAAKKIARLLDQKLKVHRTAMVMEGMGINHAHIKLYPLHGLKKKFEEMWGKKRIFFEKYPGYISTQLGPKVDSEDLKNLAKKIKK
jgi:diadenosine tetraphosphate (Ap4A) HIT family hydrolase